MTTDDKLLLADLERIASDVEDARGLEEYEPDFPGRDAQISGDDFALALAFLRRASRELETFRERLERRLNA